MALLVFSLTEKKGRSESLRTRLGYFQTKAYIRGCRRQRLAIITILYSITYCLEMKWYVTNNAIAGCLVNMRKQLIMSTRSIEIKVLLWLPELKSQSVVVSTVLCLSEIVFRRINLPIIHGVLGVTQQIWKSKIRMLNQEFHTHIISHYSGHYITVSYCCIERYIYTSSLIPRLIPSFSMIMLFTEALAEAGDEGKIIPVAFFLALRIPSFWE